MFEGRRPRNQYEDDTPQSPEERRRAIAAMESARFAVELSRVEESEDFPGSAIVLARRNGQRVGFAIRRNPEGQLEGNEITYKPDNDPLRKVEILGVQQLHPEDFANPGMKPILEAALEHLDRRSG